MRIGIDALNARIAQLEAFDPTSISSHGSPEVAELENSIRDTVAQVFGWGGALVPI
jgi:hypothetical protein